ncbi:hypothetical protein ACOSQ3_003444 [Xanthoceras sorbifolium]
MLANFKCAFKNHNSKGKLWHAARVGSGAGFNEALKFVARDSSVEKWTRHAFDCHIKSDHVINNMSECFNSWIKDEKDKPILTLLQSLRRKIIGRFCEKWEEVEKLKDFITPYAREHMLLNEKKKKKKAKKLQVIHVIKPPFKHSKIGRPMKARRKVADESRAPTKTFCNKCQGCKMIGHNICACPNKVIRIVDLVFSHYLNLH